MATDITSVHTQLLVDANMMPEGSTLVSSLDAGGNLFKWGIFKLSELVKMLGIF